MILPLESWLVSMQVVGQSGSRKRYNIVLHLFIEYLPILTKHDFILFHISYSKFQGNYVGLTEEAMTKMNPLELSQKVDSARKSLYKAGCHFVIDTIKDLPPVVEEINRRLAMGLNP